MAIRLRVLGSADLTRADGRHLDTLLQQPKRLALLVYLALNQPLLLDYEDRIGYENGGFVIGIAVETLRLQSIVPRLDFANRSLGIRSLGSFPGFGIK